MRRLSPARFDELWALLHALPRPPTPGLVDTFLPRCAGAVMPGTIARALAERAGPATDYTSPPQQPHEMDDINARAEAGIRRDLQARHEGKPEHDLDTTGRRLRPGT